MTRPRSDVFERFSSKVEVVESGCHEWRSQIKRDGYGRFHHEGKGHAAHRVAYMLYVGPIPDGKVIMHACDNRICVNPKHLRVGTLAENIADMDAKKRRGTKSKLTNADVEEIKRMYSERHSQFVIADKFGVHQTCISRIVLGKTTKFKE